MAAFQDTREQTEQKVMVHLLSEIERNPSFTQRGLAGELNIALGLMNQYLKRCVVKGWVRGTQVSPRRILYFITPKGVAEKGNMMKDYLSRSLSFFRDAKTQCEEAFNLCQVVGQSNIALFGPGDLADIAKLVGSSQSFKMTCIDDFKIVQDFDVVIITDTQNPQKTYDDLLKYMPQNQIITLPILKISRSRDDI